MQPPCTCFIVPPKLMRRLAADQPEGSDLKGILQATYLATERLRATREAIRGSLVSQRSNFLTHDVESPPAEQRLFDCQQRHSLPGKPVDPSQSGDSGIKTVHDITAKLDEFYRNVLHRNSVDNRGIDLVSSIHYREYDTRPYDNAFWNGQQMVYGDGDDVIFGPMYASPDVIGHEITHGVTQYESGLRYEGEPGALNESVSDCFGAVFNQWLNGWSVDNREGWLIGARLIAQPTRDKGITCLRDMVDPGAGHCLSPQPSSYSQFDPTGDVHDNSGIPNHAFALFARALGGNSWDRSIKIWYDACVDRRLSGSATIADFARLTVVAATQDGAGAEATEAWRNVEVSV
jgi:Zn-dependent metalloprotease